MIECDCSFFVAASSMDSPMKKYLDDQSFRLSSKRRIG